MQMFYKFEYLLAGDNVQNLDPIAMELYTRDQLAQRFSQLPTAIDELNIRETWIVGSIETKKKEADDLKESMREAKNL